MVSEDFPSAFLSPSPEDDSDTRLDLDLDAMETPSDSESLPFPISDMDLEGKGPEVLMVKHFGGRLKSSSQECFFLQMTCGILVWRPGIEGLALVQATGLIIRLVLDQQ